MDYDVDDGCTLWVLQNIKKFSKMMGVSLDGMENQILLFFIERRRTTKKKKGENVPKGRKSGGSVMSRELKRLESLINYEGRKKLKEGGGDRQMNTV